MEPTMAEPERLCLILQSGCFDRVHYGLAMASPLKIQTPSLRIACMRILTWNST